MKSPHVYDKAKYHHGTIAEYGLADEHAENHTVVILRWLIENHLMSEFYMSECAPMLTSYRNGKISIHELYRWWDCCLIEDMLSERGNAFAMHYFDFEAGQYLNDYVSMLQGGLPSEFHVIYSEENYQKIRKSIDLAYRRWATPKRWWWPF